MEVVLYSRSHCPLCDEAKEMLDVICDMLYLTYKEVDIYTDDRLLEKYQLMIPVIEVDGKEIMFGKIHYSTLKKTLEEQIKP